jgi:pyroglutamyl-peptidase
VTLLLTGFGPFGSTSRKPSELVARELDGAEIAGRRVRGLVLPVSTVRAPLLLDQAIDQDDPELVLLLGVAVGRSALSVERVAVNVLDFPEPDNDGELPVDVPIVEGGPAAYFSTLKVRVIGAAWQAAGIPGYVSDTAGTYLCNQTLYAALHKTSDRRLPVGFLHLPTLPEEAAVSGQEPGPSMALATMVAGVRVAIESALEAHEG